MLSRATKYSYLLIVIEALKVQTVSAATEE